MKLEFFQQIFEKYLNIKLNENAAWAEMFRADRQTDGKTNK
jgi:hypothetical protein